MQDGARGILSASEVSGGVLSGVGIVNNAICRQTLGARCAFLIGHRKVNNPSGCRHLTQLLNVREG